jgi:hypothetical protein
MKLHDFIMSLRSLPPLNLAWPVEDQNEWWRLHSEISAALTQATEEAPDEQA